MKKITDFIVDKRYFFLVLFIILAGISIYFSNKVNINSDFSKYLPSDSETRIGMDIMENDFQELKDGSLYVMFKDLSNEEKDKIYTSFNKIKDVSLEYENTNEYNKDNYTLYILNINNTSHSKEARDLYSNIKEDYKDYEVYFGGNIAEANKPVLDIWVVAIAILFALIILIIMCESYIEPFLFLFAIGLGVFLNKGTNVIFANVSNITNSIVAILQMALSMDYSIMLMNRYIEEKSHEKNKIVAMKKALYASFSAITSSSVTTIVGLLSLVFMSFTIGKDLGLVLAKGVLFSLISIFFVLPGLILMFDKLILKTKKKALNVKLNKLGNISYKLRHASIFIFILLLGGSYCLKGNLNILYTDSETDKIKDIFKEDNQIAIIYNNKYEKEISDYCKKIDYSQNSNIKEVLCYGNTLNEELDYKELKQRLTSYSKDLNISDELIKILYYYYNNKDKKQELTLNEFITFIKGNVINNELLDDYINKDIEDNIKQLEYFSDSKKINDKYSSLELAKIFGIDKEVLDNLLVIYNTNNINSKMGLDDFIKVINEDVLNDDNYKTMIDDNLKKELTSLANFTNKEFINKSLSAEELETVLGISQDDIKSLMLLYYINHDSDKVMSLQEFIITTNYLKNNTNYLDDKDVSMVTNLVSFALNENNINNTSLNKLYLDQVFKLVDANLVEQVYQGLGLSDDVCFTPIQFINLVLDNFRDILEPDKVNNLNLLLKVMSDETVYKASDLASLLNQDINNIRSIYVMSDYINNNMGSYLISPYNLIKTIMDNKDSLNIDLSKISLLYKVMDGVINNYQYSYGEIAQMFNIDSSKVKLVYSLREINNNKNVRVSIKDFGSFLKEQLNNVSLKNKFKDDDINKINNINRIISDSLNNKYYNKDEMYNTLKVFSNDLNDKMIDLVYIYNGSIYNYDEKITFSVERFINYINNEILQDRIFRELIDEDMVLKINDAKDMIDDSKSLLVGNKYSRMIINTTYKEEDAKTFSFIQNIKDDLNNKNKEIYVIGNSPMAYDISKAFDKEMNFITILTMLTIFIVVAITFKSLIIPLILVLIIQCAVFITMGILSLLGGSVYFIALIIVQSILMGATIDYAILYTTYYREFRVNMKIKDAIIGAYNSSIHTILTSASILIIVTLIVGNFASAIAAKICITISEGTFCSLVLILFILPPLLGLFDKYVCKKDIR